MKLYKDGVSMEITTPSQERRFRELGYKAEGEKEKEEETEELKKEVEKLKEENQKLTKQVERLRNK